MKVYIVGAGPGDPELITLKGLKVISVAEVIIYDRLIDRQILKYAPPECQFIYAGKEKGKHHLSQEEINKLMYTKAKAGYKVVRLKGGDPLLFGRGGEEILYLVKRGVDIEIIPGVSSVNGVSASAFIPLTHRDLSSSVAIISGHPPIKREERIDWEAVARMDTVVILMGAGRRQYIARKLIEAGKDPAEPVAFIEKGTTDSERTIVTSLGEVAQNPPDVNPPALFVVGKVVRIREEVLNALLSHVCKS